MKKFRSAELFAPSSSSRPRYYRYSEFNDIGALLSTKESTNLLRYKFARGDTSKLTFDPSKEFYFAFFQATDVSLQHRIIDFLGDAFYLEAYHYMKAVIPHHSVFIRLLDYYREKKILLVENNPFVILLVGVVWYQNKCSKEASFTPLEQVTLQESKKPIPLEVYQSLMGPNKSLYYFFQFTDKLFMVANQDLINPSNNDYKIHYLSRVVENIAIIYNDNPFNPLFID
ncbi:hypothetical protein DFA_03931 [Cavenderia fasciculata]|uniref:Uncharacterized protein n=1 Tax=Cavenderia fasciculata TaxID=261658 RepID=F4Q0T6_CACFS|nr:uncharacterized protein DFA_03931 [Cavenderia fasciculata]EGG18437.1 hypothetical protein DFA_03931 [Cavenderia fasciculata]|eukprot:XP_004366341.1 hypothetical protein DFA_03931 [Cavenderia fasciculata]